MDLAALGRGQRSVEANTISLKEKAGNRPRGWHNPGAAPATALQKHGSAIPAFITVIWGESFHSQGMPLSFELPPLISSPSLLPALDQQRLNST